MNILNLLNQLFVAASIQENRIERLANENEQSDPTIVEKLKLKENVLGRNLSPSLQTK